MWAKYWQQSDPDVLTEEESHVHGQWRVCTCWCGSCCAWTRSGCCPHTWPTPCHLSPASCLSRCWSSPHQTLGPGGCRSDRRSPPSSGRPVIPVGGELESVTAGMPGGDSLEGTRANLWKRSRSQHHAVVVAVAAHRPVFIGQDDVLMSIGGVKGEPSHCGKQSFSFFQHQVGMKHNRPCVCVCFLLDSLSFLAC